MILIGCLNVNIIFVLMLWKWRQCMASCINAFQSQKLFLDEIKNQVEPDYYEFGCLVQNTNAVVYPWFVTV